MEIKLFEVRDRATCMPVMVTKLQDTKEKRFALLRRAGFNPFGEPVCYMFTKLVDGKSQWDAYAWGSGDRTCSTAHQYIEKHFDELEDGQVIDVEFILGETSEPKKSDL
jgi:hypothetical protein